MFLDLLRDYLRDAEKAPVAPLHSAIAFDLPLARKHFLEAAETIEREATSRALDQHRWSLLLDEREELDDFLRTIAYELRAGLCAGSDPQGLQQHIHWSVDVYLGLATEGLSQVRKRELSRIGEQASENVGMSVGAWDIERYVLEIRAIRKTPSGARITNIGKMLLDLPETDAVRWLLTIEALQSMGPGDRYHVSRAALEAILTWRPDQPTRVRMLVRDQASFQDNVLWPFTVSILQRLRSLGVLANEVEDWWSFLLVPAYRPVLEEIVSQRRTPISMLAESLIAEEQGTLSGHAPVATPNDTESAAEVQARHARMVVHEIRNALLPVQMAQEGLYQTLSELSPGGAWKAQKERLDRGIDRVFRFVADLEKVASLSAVRAETFDLAAAIQDAIQGLNGSLAVEAALARQLPRLVGHRERFTLAIVNILRNAAQNSPKAKARVRVGAMMLAEDRVEVTIEDDGPGVPEEHRARIFEQGFSLRPGGSGQGLALVREVVEVEMRGEVRCEQSDLGGAKLTLVLPLRKKEMP